MRMSKKGWNSKKSWNQLATSLVFETVLFVCLIFCAGITNLSAEQVDRLLVSVNGSVVTEGDLYVARSLNELVFSGQAENPSPREAEIDRLIDLELIHQELKNLRVELEDESLVETRILQLRQRYAAVGGISERLENLGISETELYSFLKLDVLIGEFLKFRFRPFVRVSKEEIEDYYRQRLQPQLQESGIDLPPLNEVSDKIEVILEEEKINDELNQWIENARSNAKIEYFRNDGVVAPEPGNSNEFPRPATE